MPPSGYPASLDGQGPLAEVAHPLLQRGLLARLQSHLGIRNRIRLRAELDVALFANLHGDRLSCVSGSGGLALWRLPDSVLGSSPLRSGPPG